MRSSSAAPRIGEYSQVEWQELGEEHRGSLQRLCVNVQKDNMVVRVAHESWQWQQSHGNARSFVEMRRGVIEL